MTAPNTDRFSEPLHDEGRDVERERDIEDERADDWQSDVDNE